MPENLLLFIRRTRLNLFLHFFILYLHQFSIQNKFLSLYIFTTNDKLFPITGNTVGITITLLQHQQPPFVTFLACAFENATKIVLVSVFNKKWIQNFVCESWKLVLLCGIPVVIIIKVFVSTKRSAWIKLAQGVRKQYILRRSWNVWTR